MAADPFQDDDGSLHLKQVSRIKHVILQKYLPSWEVILGSQNRRLCYFDCYAGPGAYEFEGQKVDGSPIIAVAISGELRLKDAEEFVGRAGA